MTTLKKFAELGTVHRGEPCQEYPGSWIVSLPLASGSEHTFILHWKDGSTREVKGCGKNQLQALADGYNKAGISAGALAVLDYWEEKQNTFSSLEEALAFANRKINEYEDAHLEYDARDIAIYWKCSDNDPRVGQVWFTGCYQHGRFNIFGAYRESW